MFDRITFDNDLVLEDELRRNGFTEAQDGDSYIQLFGLPSTITDTGNGSKPIYSSGQHWVD